MVEFERNKDGSVIVKLGAPIRVAGASFDTDRLTIPAIKGKHLRKAPFNVGGTTTLGQLVEFAAMVVEPIGCVDELDPMDSLTVATEVGACLSGKKTSGG
jgi:hypothetical protein